jgi:hypothetical protein
MGPETKNYCAGEGQQQFHRPPDRKLVESELYVSQSRETVKYGHEYRGTRNQECLCCRSQQQFTIPHQLVVRLQPAGTENNRGISIVGSLYQATTNADIKDFMCCNYSDFRACKIVRLIVTFSY